MPRTQTRFVCQKCGHEAPRWLGRCPDCGEWNSLLEEAAPPRAERGPAGPAASRSGPLPISAVPMETWSRAASGIAELDRVLGGGVVPGSLVLVGGDPGIGKSTLLLQAATLLAATHGPVLYVSGEESERQIKMRAERLQTEQGAQFPKDLFLVTETNLDVILEHITSVKPRLAVIDSIQTVFLGDLSSAAGSVSQVRESAVRLQGLA